MSNQFKYFRDYSRETLVASDTLLARTLLLFFLSHDNMYLRAGVYLFLVYKRATFLVKSGNEL